VADHDARNRRGRLNTRPATLLCGTILAAMGAVACVSESPSPVQLRVGPAPSDARSFVPRTALAEYLDLPQARRELRVMLADYEASCDRFVPPRDGETYVSVLVVTPDGTDPGPATYAWAGHDAHGGTPGHPDRPFALPKVQLGPSSTLLPPGGSVRLTQVSLERDGYVEGVLDFQFAGDAKRPATSLQGTFRARICKTNHAPKP
jgi:hypothetical protein